MTRVNIKKTVKMSVDEAVTKITEALKSEGFGILTRIDFHAKVKEKLNKEIPATVVLGACNPKVAYEVWQENTDVMSLIPCNAVVRDLGGGQTSIEIAKPTAMVTLIDKVEKSKPALLEADGALERALAKV